jgi:hypothetical protein
VIAGCLLQYSIVTDFDVCADDPRGIACYDAPRRHVSCDYCTRRYDASLPYRDPWKDNRASADEALRSNVRMRPQSTAHVVT